MNSGEPTRDAADGSGFDTEVLVIGGGLMGIYELYLAREAGFSVMLVDQAGGPGGVWWWNRYPGARFDSESYTYGYLFSRELFDDWKWSEHFAAQPETERYLNHVVDRYDLRRHMRFNAKVVSAVWDADAGGWTVGLANGDEIRAQFVVAATGGLSVPYFPDVPGRERFGGIAHHTGLWPHTPVDFNGKRVAVVGTGPSGVQIVPLIVDQVSALTVYQRTPNWCTPLNNRPITDEEQAELRRNFDSIRETLLTAPSGFLHPPNPKRSDEASKQERLDFYEKLWHSPGFSKLTSNYTDLRNNKVTNAEWCEFIAGKIRSIVKDPETADKLIPKDHLYGGKRTPFENGYFAAFNLPHVELVDIKANPMIQVTETGIESADGLREFDIIVWATGFDFGTGALTRMGVQGVDGQRLEEFWRDGPSTYLGFMSHGYPNFFFPGGPHGAGGGNYPRYGSDQVEFIARTMAYVRDHGYDVIEATEAAQDEWMTMVETLAPSAIYSPNHSHYYGANIPGKPRRYLLNPGGRDRLHQMTRTLAEGGYPGFLSYRPARRAGAEDAAEGAVA